jgi:hypothetical protein
MSLEELCRRRMRRRISSIRAAIDRRQQLMSKISVDPPDSDFIARETGRRIMRGQASSQER